MMCWGTLAIDLAPLKSETSTHLATWTLHRRQQAQLSACLNSSENHLNISESLWIHFGIYRDFWDTLKSGTLHPVSLTLFGYIYSAIIGIVPALARSFWNSFVGANGPQIWHSWHMSFFCAWKLWSEESWPKRAINLSHLQPAQTSEFNATPS